MRDGVSILYEVVPDYTKAIWEATTQAFYVGISILEYNERCFKLLNNKYNDIGVLQYLIKIDIFHTIRTVCINIFAYL